MKVAQGDGVPDVKHCVVWVVGMGARLKTPVSDGVALAEVSV